MMKKTKKTVLAKRLTSLLLAGFMALGDLGSMHVSAQEPTVVEKTEISADQGVESQEQGEQNGNGQQSQNPAGQDGSGQQPQEPAEQGGSGQQSQNPAEQDGSGQQSQNPAEQGGSERQPEDTQTNSPAEENPVEIVEDSLSFAQGAETLAAPTKLKMFVDSSGASEGQVRLYWYYNMQWEEWDAGGYSFEIYRSETENGEYERTQADYVWYETNEKDVNFGAYVPIGSLNPETGNAKKYYFKVKAVRQEADGATAESPLSEPAENEEIVMGSGYDTSYKGICFLYDGEPIRELELHVGETKKLGLGLIKKDGTVVPMKTLKSQIQKVDLMSYNYIEWQSGFVNVETEWLMDDEKKDSGEYMDVDFSMEEDVLNGYEQYVTANKLVESGEQGQYFIEVEASVASVFGFFQLRLPVTILEAEEGVTYEKGFTPAHICTTKEEAYAYAREIQRKRTTGVILVKEGIFNQSNIYKALNPEEIYDTYAERNGMRPDEGDYIFYHIGDLSKVSGEIVTIDSYQHRKLSVGGSTYDAYTLSGPYLTTRAQEDKVDAEIRKLLSPGGALYSVSQTGSETQKAEAIASFVKSHVTYIGSRDPKYHTCYSALIDKTGTCEAYSLLYMRLAREMGLASKMVGTTMDANGNCHDFNIVRVDGKWYHIDALGDCKLHTGRPGADLADPYLDQRFINNYLSKISGSGYQYVSNGTVTIEDDFGEREEFSSLSAAKDRVKELAALEENRDRTYRVLISKDMSPDDVDALDFAEAADRVTIDLYGHTMKIPDYGYLDVRASRVTNGAFTIGSLASLTLNGLLAGQGDDAEPEPVVYDNLSIGWKQTTSGVSYSDKMCSLRVENVASESEHVGSLYLEDSVKIASNLSYVSFTGDIDVNGSLTADNVSMFENVRVHGNVTAKELEITGNGAVLDGNVKVTKSLNCESDITVKGDWTVSGWSGFGYPYYPYESENFGKPIEITVEGSLSLSGTTAAFVEKGGYWDYYDGPAFVKIVRKYDGQGKLISQGQFSVSGSLRLPEDERVLPVDMVERTVFDISPIDYVEDVLWEDAAFHTGDLIAEFSVQKILDGSGKSLGALNNTNLKDYIKCESIDGERGSLELDETMLLVSSECVRVSYGEGEALKTATYSSLKNAVAGLDSLAGKAPGAYTFTFLDNGVFTKSLTLPSYVTYARFESESEYQLDFKGYTLTTAGDMAVSDSLYLLSSGKIAGTIVLTKNNVKAGGTDTEDNVPTFTFLIHNGGLEALVSNVNITANNTAVTLSMDTAGEQDFFAPLSLESTVTANTLYVKSGSWILNGASLGTLQLDPESRLKISDLLSVTNLNIEERAELLADTIVQGSKGKTELASGSVLAVRKKAVLYNPTLSAEEQDAHIYLAQDAGLEIQGKLTRASDQSFLSFGILEGDGDDLVCADFTKDRKLFSTKISNFPVEALHIEQGTEDSGSIYNIPYQIADGVYVGAEWFTVLACGVDQKETKLASFTKWTEAAAYVNTLSNSSMTYIVEILEDVDTKSPLTMPAKAKGIIFRSGKEENVTIQASGDIKLSADIAFESVDLALTKYDNKSKRDIPAAVSLNGKTLAFYNSSAEFASIAGTKTSALIVEGSGVTVTGAVTSLSGLTLRQASLTAGSNIAVTDTLVMKSAELAGGGKIDVKNLVSEDSGNTITYGGNAKNNILTITGTVTAPGNWAADLEVKLAGSDQTARIRKGAVSLNPKAPGETKTGEVLLCNAAKAGAGWFVMGNQPSAQRQEWTIQSAAYKSGNGIYKGGSPKAVWLMAGDYPENYSFDSSFATLQEALSEIDRLADPEMFYLIEIHTDDLKSVTAPDKGLTFPSKTEELVIVYSGSETFGDIYYKGNLTLKSNLVLTNIRLVPKEKSAIVLNKFMLYMSECEVDPNTGISGITGSGVTTDSGLWLEDMDNLTVLGSMNKLGILGLSNSFLTVQGDVNVGEVNVDGESGISGPAKITRDKKTGEITKVEPQITMQGAASIKDGSLGIRLLEKSGTEYTAVDFTGEDAQYILNQGLNIAKAPYMDGSSIYPMNKGLSSGGSPLELLKSAGYLTCYGDQMYGAVLCYKGGLGFTERRVNCRTFGDAVAEINNYKKKLYYTIEITRDAVKIADAAPTAAPKALTMPNKNYISGLVIKGAGESGTEAVDLPYTGNITFTSDTALNNINFLQRVKASDGTYVNAPEAGAAVTVSVVGFEMNVTGNVTFNTPLVLKGGNKGILALGPDGRLQTLTNGYSGESGAKSVLHGSISDFARIEIDDQVLELREYRKDSQEANPSKAASLTAAALEIMDGGLELRGDYAKGTVTVKNLYISSRIKEAALKVGGKLALTNVTLEGVLNISIQADQNFTVSGSLINNACPSVTLLTRLSGAGKAPYLTVNGTVETSEAIEVGVLAELTSSNPDEYVQLKDAPAAAGQLLTAKTAPASAFRPKAENYKAGSGMYSAENPTGYMVMKVKTGVYVYDGSRVRVALCRGDYSAAGRASNLTEAIDAGDLLGYYTDFASASAAVDALKDASAVYTLILTGDMGEGIAPAAVTLPSKAGTIYVTSLSGERKAIVFGGNITLKCASVFDGVDFAPVNNKKGASYGFAAGDFDLTLRNVGVLDSGSGLLDQVEEKEAMALKDISGKGKQTVTLDSKGLELSGGISKVKTLAVTECAVVRGDVNASVLELSGEVTLTAKGAVTLDTVKTQRGNNTLIYTRTAKGATNLTINKEIEADNGFLDLNMLAPDKKASDFLLRMDSDQVILSDSLKLVNMPIAASDAYTQLINGEMIDDDGTLVKANKGIYLAGLELYDYHVDIWSVNNAKSSLCLDYQQAVNEINNLSDKTEEYFLEFLAPEVRDTNLTDKTQYSKFALPSKNKASAVWIAGLEEEKTKVTFVNDISGSGRVALNNIILDPVNEKGEPKDFKIGIVEDNAGAYLILDRIEAGTGTAGMISQITGKKNETTVDLRDCGEIVLRTGFSNIGDLYLNDTKILGGGSSGLRNLVLKGISSFVSLGKSTLENIDTEDAVWQEEYIGTRQEKGNPLLTLNGQAKGKVVCKVYTEKSTIAHLEEVSSYIGQEGDVALISAKKASADCFLAASFLNLFQERSLADDLMTRENLVAYKDGSYVKNGDRSNMAVKLTSIKDDDTVVSEAYARSFEEAVADINNAADTSVHYELELLAKAGDRQVKTTKKGTAFGALTLPTKAASITIKSEDANNPNILMYTGTLKTFCDVTFEDILLTEGTVKNNVFTPSYQITPVPGAKTRITFNESAKTLAEGREMAGADTLMLASVSGNKGTMQLSGTQAQVKGAVNLASLRLLGGSQIRADGKVTVTDLYAESSREEDEANLIGTSMAINITNIYSASDEEAGNLVIDAGFTKITKEGSYGNTQLTINGVIDYVAVQLRMNRYNLKKKAYEAMDEAAVNELLTAGTGKPAAYQKLVVMPKAGLSNITLQGNAGARLFKYEGGVYLTDQKTVVHVTGSGDGTDYSAEFMEWEQAVKEIDRIANVNRNYTIELCQTVGAKDGEITPISAVTLPAKAKDIFITSSGEEKNGIFFTSDKLTLKCPVTMHNIALIRVKKNAKTKLYDTVDVHTINTGNFEFVLTNPVTSLNGMEAKAGNITGNAKGSFVFSISGEDAMKAPALKITNVGTVTLSGTEQAELELYVENGISGVTSLELMPNVRMKSAAAVSVKNLSLKSSALEAKDITVSTLTELYNETEIKAGTSTIGDGKLTLNNIQVSGENNTLLAKQDKNGNSLLTINGKITDVSVDNDSVIRVGLYYNNQSGFAQLYDGMALANAKNAAVTAQCFVPYYTESQSDFSIADGMGSFLPGGAYGVYKNKNVIYYGKLKQLT